ALFVGASATAFADGFGDAGGDRAVLDLYADVEAARGPFAELVRAGGTVLLKGSRGIALERLLEGGHV
ncbi:MAG: hypothetical protein VX913_12115, partial [Planctomycetota bacterium]|nr:hypothetical protein [Planctomycetota bacterium]